MGPTDKQVNYILMLLSKAGYSTRFMDSEFKSMGVGMVRRSGSVEAWIRSLNVAEVSALIDRLKSAGAEK